MLLKITIGAGLLAAAAYTLSKSKSKKRKDQTDEGQPQRDHCVPP